VAAAAAAAAAVFGGEIGNKYNRVVQQGWHDRR